MLYTETPDDVLCKYVKERCTEIEERYDDLKRAIIQVLSTEDELKKFELMGNICHMLNNLSYDHIDTLDRYIYAYESRKRLSNALSKQ